MRRVVATALVLALSAAVGTAADASVTTHNCGHLLVDPHGNAKSWFLPTKPYNAEADLLSVDAVTTASAVQFTVRMASVNPQPTTGTVVTVYFVVNHQGGASDFSANVDHEIDGTTYSLQNNDTYQVTGVTGTTNPTAGTYLISVPRSDIGAGFRGAMLNQLGVIVSQTAGVNLANGGFIEQSTGPEYHYRVGYVYGCTRK